MTTAGTGTTSSPATPAAASFIYVFQQNDANGIISIFAASATATTSPLKTLVLPAGDYPASVATDAAGNIYVGCQGIMGDLVLVYPAGATGSAVPARVITVPGAPFSITVDPSGSVTRDAAGNLYFVADRGIQGSNRLYTYTETIYNFSPPFSSTSTPIRSFSPSSSISLELAVH